MELYAYSVYNYYFVYQLLPKRFSQLSINDSLYTKQLKNVNPFVLFVIKTRFGVDILISELINTYLICFDCIIE